MQTNGDKAALGVAQPGPGYGRHTGATGDAGHRDLHRLTVTEAAAMMGVTESAVRKRVQRGQIPHDKEDNGRLYVYLDPRESRPLSGKVRDGHASRSRPPGPGQSRDSYVRTLEERVGFLEEQVRRQTDIIAGLVQRVPELKAPAAQEPREAPQTNTEDAGGSEPRPATEEAQGPAERRSWLHRFFFGG
jgi:hypothetical protein